ncbi:hypothetical protein [Paenibacillus wynnii]|uniref:hypothetical protein n=1 Tax=Paenibacillus wynnii TaxID=268407 RepID=UPI0027943C51|nr:hypothetical protein [Paenibacillus wynnii]MDQ0194273.1 hypothetical protein [Paenibacillus wynnii]
MMRIPVSYKMFTISLLSLCILVILGNYRWERMETIGDFNYKYDRWAKQSWVEFYFPLAAISNGMERQAMTGELVNKWIERTRLSDLHKGLLSLNLILTILSLKNVIFQPAVKKPKKDEFTA